MVSPPVHDNIVSDKLLKDIVVIGDVDHTTHNISQHQVVPMNYESSISFA